MHLTERNRQGAHRQVGSNRRLISRSGDAGPARRIWTLILWQQGTNPGKKTLGLEVVSAETGLTATFGTMFVRNFLFGTVLMGLASSITFGVVPLADACMIFTDRNQRLIDKMAKTLVVKA